MLLRAQHSARLAWLNVTSYVSLRFCFGYSSLLRFQVPPAKQHNQSQMAFALVFKPHLTEQHNIVPLQRPVHWQ